MSPFKRKTPEQHRSDLEMMIRLSRSLEAARQALSAALAVPTPPEGLAKLEANLAIARAAWSARIPAQNLCIAPRDDGESPGACG